MKSISNKLQGKKILLNGYYGFGNFGDELILSVLIQELKKIETNLDITVMSSNPQKTTKIYGVKSFNRMDFSTILKEIRNADIFIYGGGSLFQDVTSSLTIYYYILVLFIAQVFKLKTALLAQGIGPLNKKLSHLALKFVLKKSNLITVRDTNSYQLLKQMNIDSYKTNDLAWIGLDNINKSDEEDLFKDLGFSNDTKYLVVNLRDWHSLNNERIEEIAKAVYHLAQSKKIGILILPIHHSFDLEVSKQLYNSIKSYGDLPNINLLNKNLSTQEINTLIKSASFVIAMRFHALLIAIQNGIRIFGISYDPKVKALMESIQSSFVDIENIQTVNLLKEFENIFLGAVNFNAEMLKLAKNQSKTNLDLLLETL